MSKRPEDNVPDYRAIMVQKIFDTAITEIAKNFPQRTPAQQQRWARYIAEEYAPYEGLRSEKGWSPPNVTDVTAQLDATCHLRLPDAECHRTPPSPGDLERAIAEAENITSPAARMSLHREIVRLSPDQLLARSKGVDLSAATAVDTPKLPVAPKRAEKAAHEMTQSELSDHVGKTLGRDPHHMLASDIRRFGEELVKNSLPKTTPAIDALRAKLQLGRAWLDIPGIERINASREAREVLGKDLRELGIGP